MGYIVNRFPKYNKKLHANKCMQGRSSRGTTRLGENLPLFVPYRGKRSSSKNVIHVFIMTGLHHPPAL